MIQQLIYDRFGVYYNVFYIAQLLKNLGFSYQKAAFVSDHLNEQKRQEWRTTTWPQILRLTKEPEGSAVWWMKHHSRAVGHPDIHGRGVASNPRSRPPASAAAIKSSG